MACSWSAMRRRLEKENLCDGLQGRVRYFVTSYRESHDGNLDRLAVYIDGREMFAADEGLFRRWHWYEAFYEYDNQDIERSLSSSNPLVRLFAVYDRRTGKRRLVRDAERFAREPLWLCELISVRYKTEGIAFPHEGDAKAVRRSCL